MRKLSLAIAGSLLSLLPFAQTARAQDEILIKYFDLTEGRIAFNYGIEGEKKKIYVLDFATLVAKPLESPGGSLESPRFSPDGKKIAYVSDRGGGSKHIYVANQDGTGAVAVTSGGGLNETPDWSPDGKKIVFTSTRTGEGVDLFVTNADGTGTTALTKSTKQITSPRWSPVGDEILYSTNEYWPGLDLLAYKVATKKISIVTTGKISATKPAWDTTGANYAYVFGPAEDTDIWISKRDAGKSAGVVVKPGLDTDPEWMDDGKRLLYLSETTPGLGHYEIFMLDVTTMHTTQITDCPGDIRGLSWTPTSPVHLTPKAKPTPLLGEGPPIAIPPPIPPTPAPNNF